MAAAIVIAAILKALGDATWAPTVIFAGMFAAAFLLQRLLRPNRVNFPWRMLSWLVTALVAFGALAYLWLPVLFEDAETDIACISAVLMRGQPVYPAVDAAQRYILLYGPLTYLAHVPFYWVFGENLIAFKLLGCSACLLSLLGLYRICRHYASPPVALIGLGCASIVLFRYIGVEFWGRIDPLILLLVVLAVWAALEAPRWLALAVNALAFAAAPNLKVSAAAYLLPLAGFLLVRFGWRWTLVTVAIAAALVPAPFLLPQVALSSYLETLHAAAGHGLVPAFLLRNLQYAALLVAPVAAILWSGTRRSSPAQKLYFTLIAIGLLATSLLGAKSGAGSYHLLPFIVPLLHLYFWRRSEWEGPLPDRAFATFALAWVLTTMVLSEHHLRSVLREFAFARAGAAAIADIREAEQRYGGQTLAVGIGEAFDDPRTRYEFLPVFHGQPFTINGAAVRDLQFGGVDIPAATIETIRRCETRVWLIPAGQTPFTAGNTYYDRFHPAFDKAFQEAFLQHYRKTSSGGAYDAWTCGL